MQAQEPFVKAYSPLQAAVHEGRFSPREDDGVHMLLHNVVRDYLYHTRYKIFDSEKRGEQLDATSSGAEKTYLGSVKGARMPSFPALG